MFSQQLTNCIRTRIAAPGCGKDQPYQKFSIWKVPGKINKGEHHSHVYHPKERRHYLICLELGISKYVNEHKHHERNDHAHHSIFFKIQRHQHIVDHSSKIACNFQGIKMVFPDLHNLIKLLHSDQRDPKQCKKQHITSTDNSQKRNCDQHNTA